MTVLCPSTAVVPAEKHALTIVLVLMGLCRRQHHVNFRLRCSLWDALCRLQVNLKACLSDMKVRGSNRFLCLCERSARLWPWLRGQQISSLREFLLSERDLTFTRRVFECINARFKGHALCDSFHQHQNRAKQYVDEMMMHQRTALCCMNCAKSLHFSLSQGSIKIDAKPASVWNKASASIPAACTHTSLHSRTAHA